MQTNDGLDMVLKSYPCFLALLFAYLHTHADGADTVEAKIDFEFIGREVLFNASLPELQGIPGGREPFYTYLWDFGDGHFSTGETPKHRYLEPGDYEVTLYTVNNYDNGPRPRRPRQKIKVDSTQTATEKVASAAERGFFNADGLFRLSKNANALPDQDMVVIVGVNTLEKGTIHLLTNEKIFGPEGFVYAGQTAYNGEIMKPVDDYSALESRWATIPGVTVTQSGSPDYGIREELEFAGNEGIEYFSNLYGSYKTVTSYEVMGNGDAQFSLVNLDITPEMLADTNATVTITGVFVPEKGPARVHRLDVPIVTSHDPNKMSLKQSRLSYRRLSKRKELTYKVQFQNDGEGDAKNIRLEIKLPEILDPSTFELRNLYPEIDSCATTPGMPCYSHYTKGPDTLVFQFNNIALPGSKAPDVADKDSTQGFIRFSIQPKKRLPNRPFKGQTQIYFDKNEPITTNFATGRFRKGLSPMAFAGYNHFLALPESESDAGNGAVFGLGLAPIAPYRKLYWQIEAYASTYRTTVFAPRVEDPGAIEYELPGTGQVEWYEYKDYDRSLDSRFMQLRIVPLHIRYNFNSWVSAGAGAALETTVNLRHKEERTYYLLPSGQEVPVRVAFSDDRLPMGKLHVQPFLDVNIGQAYLGPALGFRYIYGGKQGQLGHIYAAWRF